MNAMRHIRKLLNLSQAAFADVAGVNQATVSRWETGLSEPSREELMRIREHAIGAGVEWNDALFFQPPLEV